MIVDLAVCIKLAITSDCEKTTHIHLLILSNKNNTKQGYNKLNLRKIISMNFIKPESRAQVSFGSLDEMIPAEHQVRFLDAFVNKLDLAKLQFNVKPLNKEGRPPFHPSLFLTIQNYTDKDRKSTNTFLVL